MDGYRSDTPDQFIKNDCFAATGAQPGGGDPCDHWTTFDSDEYVMAAINAGASGFPLGDTEPETLLTRIRTVAPRQCVIT